MVLSQLWAQILLDIGTGPKFSLLQTVTDIYLYRYRIGQTILDQTDKLGPVSTLNEKEWQKSETDQIVPMIIQQFVSFRITKLQKFGNLTQIANA